MTRCFYYDESSPTCIRWKVDRFSGNHGNIKSASSGDVAGSLETTGAAYVTRFNGKHIKVHHVVLGLHGKLVPRGFVVDHEDGDTTNNRAGNLRLVTQLVNSHNRRKQHNNTSGAVGVSEWKDHRGSTFWIARWQDAVGRRGKKCFSIRKYGATEAYQMAVKHREAMILTLTASGHGYTERHGK